MKTAASLFLCLGLVLAAFGHGDVHEQIETLTREIKKDPKNPQLYQRRGELHRVHEEWNKALSDFEEAARLDPAGPTDFLKGRLYYERGDLRKAKEHLDRFVARIPNSPEGRLTRARVLRDLKNYEASISDFDAAIQISERPQPEYYIERARASFLAQPKKPAEAIAGLEEGLKKLGPIITLELEAIEIESKSGSYDSAIQRLNKIINRFPRKEKWLTQRGEIELKAGRKGDAQKSFEEALAAIQKLPSQHRTTKAMVALEKTIQQNLDK